MKILALDTSSIVATCAVLDENKLLAEYILNHKRTHSQQLMPIVKEVLSSCQLKPKDIDVFAVAKGPGSFTGLRIGIATVKGLAHSTNKPVIGIPTLEALAFNMPFCEGIVVPLMDARRNRVYTGIYKWELGNFYRIIEDMAIEVEELIDILMERNERIVFNGDGTLVYKEKLMKALGDRALFSPASTNMARASSVGQLALMRANEGKLESYFDLVPDYLRKSQAEREYEERKKENEGKKQ